MFNPLTPEEETIIIGKGTEKPFSGEYNDFHHTGTFLCKRCDNPLYYSTDKFDSGCGRPSFDETIPGAVSRTTDADGQRTEITCKRCGAHLGHVFVGEKTTEKNTRHCVNSLSLRFIKEIIDIPRYETAILGGGCFWCLEACYQQIKGVIDIKSGYSGGEKEFPTYEEVCRGNTGHIELIHIIFDPQIITYEKILEIFFTIHDPTSLDKQGNDTGLQYRSVIFTNNESQKDIAEKMIHQFDDEKLFPQKIVTEVRPLTKFWIAESYHQNYFNNNPQQMYCNLVINPKLASLKMKWKNYIK